MEDGHSSPDHLCNFAAGPLDEFHLVVFQNTMSSYLGSTTDADSCPDLQHNIPRVFSFWASIPSWSRGWFTWETWSKMKWLCLGLGIHIEVHRGHNSEVTDWSMMEFPWAVNNNLNIIANIAMWPRKALPVWVVCMWPFIRRGDVLRKGEAEWKLVAANLKLSWVSSVTVKVLLNIQVTLLFQIIGI